jgi:hypothetical protein
MKTKTRALQQISLISVSAKDVAWTVGLTLVAIVAPMLLAHTPNNQWITGTIVNMTLFLASWRLGVANAVLVGALPSTIALMRGLLFAPMAPFIPFIIVSNAILVIVFSLTKKNLFWGILTASFAKSAFLLSITLLLAFKLPSPLAYMLQFPQLVTALAGGLLAVGLISSIRRFKRSN